MDTQSPLPHLFRTYAFTAAGRADALAAQEDGAHAGEVMTPEEFNHRLRRIAPARGDRFRGDHHDTCMVIERSKNANLVLYTANLVAADDRGRVVESGKGCRAVIHDKDPLRTYWLKLEPEHVARRRARGEMDDVCELNYIEKKLAYGCHATRAPAAKIVHELKSMLKKSDQPLTDEEAAVVATWDDHFTPCLARYVAAPQWPVLMLTMPPVAGGEADSKEQQQQQPPSEKKEEEEEEGEPQQPSAAEDGAAPEEPPSVKKDVGGDRATAPGFDPHDTVTVMLAVIDGQLSLLKKVYVTSIEPKHFYQLPSVESLEAFGVSVATGEDTYEKRMNK